MGGPGKAAARLDGFLRELNGGPGGTHTDHALLGNEPTLQTPWLYDWMRRPYRTQAAVRRALLTLYDTSPDGYPGNDDLGTLSAWYVFGALGLYPEVPGVGVLAIGSPLFARDRNPPAPSPAGADPRLGARSDEPGQGQEAPPPGHARSAPRRPPTFASLRLDGHAYGQPWTTYCALAAGGNPLLPARPASRTVIGAPRRPLCRHRSGLERPMPKSACAP